MDKPVAVLHNNLPQTIEWLMHHYDIGINEINMSMRMLTNRSGKRYVLICNLEQALAWEFSDVLIAPSYAPVDLVQEVRQRVR